MVKKEGAILFLERSKFSLCLVHGTNSVVFPFTPDIVRDMDVLKPDQFSGQLSAFFSTNKIPPLSIAVVLPDDVLFQKDILPPAITKPEKGKPLQPAPAVDIDEEGKNFLDTVPYEDLTNRTYPLGKGVRVIAANRQIFDFMREVFEKNNSSLESITPLSLIYGQQAAQFVLNVTTARQLYEKLDLLKQQSLPTHIIQDLPKVEESEAFTLTLTKGGNTKRLAILIGIFILLLGIMGVMVYMTTRTQAKPLPVPHARLTYPASATLTPTVSLQPSVSLPAVASLSAAQIASTHVHIVASTSTVQSAQDVKKALVTAGFKAVDIATQGGIGTNKIVITFLHTLPQNLRDMLTGIVQTVDSNVTVQETADSAFDVTITML